jgi:hypothetical protein
VFCIAEEETEADELKADVKKFLYDLRMQAEVIVVTMKSWEAHQEDNQVVGHTGRDDAMESFSKARKRIADRITEGVKGNTNSNNAHSESVHVTAQEQQVYVVCFDFTSCYVSLVVCYSTLSICLASSHIVHCTFHFCGINSKLDFQPL